MSRNQWTSPSGQSFQYQYRVQSHSNNPRIGAKNKSRSRIDCNQHLCSYVHRICLQNRLEGFNYCIRHILEDRSAPFRQCSYIHPHSGKRCPNAARRTDRRDNTLCPWHIKKLYLKKKQAFIQQLRLKSEESHKKSDTKELMKDLEHYCPNDSHDKNRERVDWVQQEDNSITASDQLRKKIAESVAHLSTSYSDEECSHALVDDIFRSDVMESDSESVDSNNEDPLKHAGVYTAEEVSLVLRDKMLRLQSLYIDQFRHFQYLLREKRNKYLMSLKTEKEINGIQTISQTVSQTNVLPQEKEDYKKLKALWRYHRSHGMEALLKKESNQKRKASIEGHNYIRPSFQICIFTKGDQICSNKSLPLSNYCLKHILYDVHQVLFRPCAAGTPPCLTPIVSYVHKNTCLNHKQLKFDKKEIEKIMDPNEDESNQMETLSTEPELYQTMDDIASLGLDAIVPGNLFGLDQFGDLGSADLLQN